MLSPVPADMPSLSWKPLEVTHTCGRQVCQLRVLLAVRKEDARGRLGGCRPPGQQVPDLPSWAGTLTTKAPRIREPQWGQLAPRLSLCPRFRFHSCPLPVREDRHFQAPGASGSCSSWLEVLPSGSACQNPPSAPLSLHRDPGKQHPGAKACPACCWTAPISRRHSGQGRGPLHWYTAVPLQSREWPRWHYSERVTLSVLSDREAPGTWLYTDQRSIRSPAASSHGAASTGKQWSGASLHLAGGPRNV